MSVAESVDQWTTKSAWMRAQGVVSASWDESDRLTSTTLGPPPLVPPKPAERAAPKPVTRNEDVLLGGSRLVPRKRDE